MGDGERNFVIYSFNRGFEYAVRNAYSSWAKYGIFFKEAVSG